jgi:hypothetical protein
MIIYSIAFASYHYILHLIAVVSFWILQQLAKKLVCVKTFSLSLYYMPLSKTDDGNDR